MAENVENAVRRASIAEPRYARKFLVLRNLTRERKEKRVLSTTPRALVALVLFAIIPIRSIEAAGFPVFPKKSDIVYCSTRSPKNPSLVDDCFAGPQSFHGFRFEFGNFWTQTSANTGAYAFAKLKVPEGAKSISFNVGVPVRCTTLKTERPKRMSAFVFAISATGESFPVWEASLTEAGVEYMSAEPRNIPPGTAFINLVGGTAGNENWQCDDLLWTSVLFSDEKVPEREHPKLP